VDACMRLIGGCVRHCHIIFDSVTAADSFLYASIDPFRSCLGKLSFENEEAGEVAALGNESKALPY